MKVIFKEHLRADGSFVGEVKLNRPLALNALDMEMILALRERLNKWQNHPQLSAVFLHGAGRAFCAGGDVKSMCATIALARKNNQDPGKSALPFFENEYRLDYLLRVYPRPVVVWGHGCVIGGGMGLFLAGSHRVLTDNAWLSMPEISIGLFPDVGGSYDLSRMPHKMGWYMALTGYRLNSVSARALNLTDFCFTESTRAEEVLQTLISSHFKTGEELRQVLTNLQAEHGRNKEGAQAKETTRQRDKSECSLEENKPVNELEKYKDKIADLFVSENIQDIYKKFVACKIKEDPVWEKARQVFLQGSPCSAGIICQQLKKAKESNLKEVFQTDLALAVNCARGHDFPEGGRAVLVEKTGSPAWRPDSVEKLEKQTIEGYFRFPWGMTNPLNDL